MILHNSSPGTFAGGPYNLSNVGSLMGDAGVRFAPHEIIVQNLGATTVHVGSETDIGSSTGYELAPGGEFNGRLQYHDELFLYGTTANATDINVTVITGG